MEQFEIWHGTYNIFGVFLESRKMSCQDIRRTCKKHHLDGLLFLHVGNENEIGMNFFNPDGSRDNCGNGLRVAAQVCKNKDLVGTSGIIHSLNLIFPFVIKNDEVTIAFPKVCKREDKWDVGGVLHKVVFTNSLERAKKNAPFLRKKYDSNITIVKKINNAVFAQTFERGVESFTASCGTGAIAVALETGTSEVLMPGGLLKIEQTPSTIFLTGRAEQVQ
ncbi:MAG: hypothetical protein AABY00_01395 [Nanoarchaeota archaeon]